MCNECGKEIDENSQNCSCCVDTTNEKKKINTKLIIGLAVGLIIIIGMLTVVIVNNNNQKDENELKNNDNDIRYEKIDLADFKIVVNDKEYKITDELKVSEFINNGWTVTYNEEILNQTVGDIQNSMSDPDTLYMGYNYIYLEQDKLALAIYFEMSIPNIRVLDSKVIAIKIYNKEKNQLSDFNFYGLKLGKPMTENQYKKIFGEENFAISEDDINRYYETSLELDDGFKVGIELITQVDTNELVSIALSIL